jgi:hypothetical protein
VPHPFHILVETNILFLQSFDFAHLRHETLFALRSLVSNRSRSKASTLDGFFLYSPDEFFFALLRKSRIPGKSSARLKRSLGAPRKVFAESRMTRRCSSAEHQTI